MIFQVIIKVQMQIQAFNDPDYILIKIRCMLASALKSE